MSDPLGMPAVNLCLDCKARNVFASQIIGAKEVGRIVPCTKHPTLARRDARAICKGNEWVARA